MSPRGKDVTRIVQSTSLLTTLKTDDEKQLWEAYCNVVKGFLGRHRAQDYVARIEKLRQLLVKTGIARTPKIHLLVDHVEKFPKNNSDYSDENAEKFHHELMPIYLRYPVAESQLSSVLSDYLWRHTSN